MFNQFLPRTDDYLNCLRDAFSMDQLNDSVHYLKVVVNENPFQINLQERNSCFTVRMQLLYFFRVLFMNIIV